MPKLTVVLAQTDVIYGEPGLNIEHLESMAQAIKEQVSSSHEKLIVFPELCLTGYHLDAILKSQSSLKDDELISRIKKLAMDADAWLYLSLVESSGEPTQKPYNTGILVSPNGLIQATYKKVHLFKPLHEHQWFANGKKEVLAITSFAKLGLLICYDLRFPEEFVKLRDQGAEMFLLVAEWPITRIEHWRVLNRARAIENQAFMIAVNRVGTDPTATYGGHSMIVDPMGNVLLELGEKEEWKAVELDLSVVQDSRQLFNIAKDAEVYPH